jgi:hypothetical protein
MLKKFAALTCALLVGTVFMVGLSGCSDNKPAAAPAGGAAAPADASKPADKAPDH